MKPLIITKQNSIFQLITAIKCNRQKRQKQKLFFVEGVRNISESVRNKWTIKYLLYSEPKQLSNWARNIIHTTIVENLIELDSVLMKQLSNKEEPSELIAIVKMRNDDVGKIKLRSNPLIVVFDRPSNKGNLGTIIRSCDALGCDGLIVTGHAVDLYDPDTVGSTMGSFFNFTVIRMESHKEVFIYIEELKSKYADIQVIGTSAHAEVVINEVDLTKPIILLIGNETFGLSNNYRERCDIMTTIPMTGCASSLNVACAASAFLYELSRQRGFRY
jgi:TrmH family RNA methyltransferase